MPRPKVLQWLSGSAYVPLSNHERDERDAGIAYKDEDAAATERAHPGLSPRLATGEVTAPPGFLASVKNFACSRKINCLHLLSILCILGFFVALTVPSARHCHGLPPSPPKHHPHGTHHSEMVDRPKQKPHEPQCGSTPTEAKARNCIFEQQLGAWVHPTCAWQEIVHEFREVVGDIYVGWSWYWDTDLKREVAAADVPKLQNGNFSVTYTTFPRAHDLHCLYCWRKVEYAIEHGVKWIDARCHQFWHTKHCVTLIAETLTGQGEQHRALTYPLLFHDCVPLTSTIES
ncbi:hypothetical protein CGRA01v4_09677 [Colletotrichum graminicola]|nr:hypothetical protein CGRA01v4_09677 [Colletotrichum graminicola]